MERRRIGSGVNGLCGSHFSPCAPSALECGVVPFQVVTQTPLSAPFGAGLAIPQHGWITFGAGFHCEKKIRKFF